MSNSSIQLIKLIASIHRTVFHAYLEDHSHAPCRFKKIDPTPPSTKIVYKVNQKPDEPEQKGLAAFPKKTTAQEYATLLKNNECDFATHTFFPCLSAQLEKRMPGTKVQWINVNVDAKVKITGVETTATLYEARHSCFLVTAPAAKGEAQMEFTVDFTVEQFGYDSSHWFLPKAEYLAKVAKTGEVGKVLDPEDQEASLEGWWEDEQKKAQEMMRKVCEELPWAEVEKLDKTVRVGYVYAFFEQADLLVKGHIKPESLHEIAKDSHDEKEPGLPEDKDEETVFGSISGR